jgi:hypothetical protein
VLSHPDIKPDPVDMDHYDRKLLVNLIDMQLQSMPDVQQHMTDDPVLVEAGMETFLALHSELQDDSERLASLKERLLAGVS